MRRRAPFVVLAAIVAVLFWLPQNTPPPKRASTALPAEGEPDSAVSDPEGRASAADVEPPVRRPAEVPAESVRTVTYRDALAQTHKRGWRPLDAGLWHRCFFPYDGAPLVTGTVVAEDGSPIAFAYALGGILRWGDHKLFVGAGLVRGGRLRFAAHAVSSPWAKDRRGYTPLLRVRAFGYQPFDYKGTPREWNDLKAGRSLHGVNIVLKRAAILEGVVLDEENRPLQGAEVWVHHEFQREPMVFPRSGTVKTKKDGRFRFGQLDPRRRQFLFARKSPYGEKDLWIADPVSLRGRIEAGRTTRLDVRAGRAGTCRVEVRLLNWNAAWHRLICSDLPGSDVVGVDGPTVVVQTRTGSHEWTVRHKYRVVHDAPPVRRFAFTIPHDATDHVVEVTLPN